MSQGQSLGQDRDALAQIDHDVAFDPADVRLSAAADA